MNNDALIRRLRRPIGLIDAVLDTDAGCEFDDQFAIAYLLHAKDRIRLREIYAAPFFADFFPLSESPADGQEKSYREIVKMLALCGCDEMSPLKGAPCYLRDEKTPVLSPASRSLARLAMEYTPENPLYVLSIGVSTNVASALLINPAIAERVVIVWLGGHAPHWPDTNAFNMAQDIPAARVLFSSGAAVVHVPCMGALDSLRLTGPEANFWLRGKGPLCDYLSQSLMDGIGGGKIDRPWSWVIYDIAVIAWVLDSDGSMLQDAIVPAPIPLDNRHYDTRTYSHVIRQVYSVDRDAIFEDLFRRLGVCR